MLPSGLLLSIQTLVKFNLSSHQLHSYSPSPAQFAPSTPTLSLHSLILSIEIQLNSKLHSHPPSLEYLIRPDNSVALTHVAQFQNTDLGTWIEAHVCAHSGELLSVTDFVAHASYNVVPITNLALTDGLETLEDPEDKESSPFGWHSDGVENTTFTECVSSPSTDIPAVSPVCLLQRKQRSSLWPIW